MKQAAMYVRVSTQQQKEGATIQSQKALLHQFAREKGFEINSELVFEDDGISGSTLVRPALDKLRDLASEGLLEHIFILSPDRLSRKYAYQALLMEEFNRNNVGLIFQNSPNAKTPADELLLQMQGMFAEYERAQITERSRRGKKYKARNGNVSVLSHAPYGYRYISSVQGCQAYFELVDKEASVIRTIFDLYVKERFSIEKIRAYLKNNLIRSPKGNSEWSRSSINNILTNSSYKGVAIYGKKERCEPWSMRLPGRRVRLNGRRSPRKSLRKKDPKEWIEIPVPKIIEDEIFELTQELLKKNQKLSLRNAKPGSLLQGLISCKECGYGFITTMSGEKNKGYNYYRCSKRDKKCCNRGLRTDSLDEAIWGSLLTVLEDPDLIQKEIVRRVSDLEKAPVYQKRKILESKVAKLDLEANRLLDAYQGDCIDLQELRKRMDIVKKEKNNLTRELSKNSSGLSKKQFLELSEAINYFSEHLKSSKMKLTLEEKRKIVRMLVQEIQIGKEDITVNHIIPLKERASCEVNACLCPGHKGAKTRRVL